MILSKKFVNDYVEIDDTIENIANNMTRVGNEYDYAGKLINATNLVIGEVLECTMHPDSDHLHVCKIDVGTEILNIVCGAPNMRKGLKVIVALPGAKLPGGEIKRGVIRGVESNGMCCSIAELGLDKKFLSEKDIEGIHELPLDAPVGEDALKYLNLDDEIVDFELTSNRSDLMSMIGMAYELSAIYNKPVNEPKPKYESHESNFMDDMTLVVSTDKVKTFLLGKVENVSIKESPEFIKTRLIACGIRPINNVVDISNYIMMETGQPLHFYDADKVGNYMEVRMANDRELLTTLDNTERTLTKNDLVICDSKGSIGLAGVMGGLDTEVTNETKNILIESAIFDAGTVRKTAKRILRSEASSRFEKGLDINRTYLAMERSKELLSKYANGNVLSGTVIYDLSNKEEKEVNITLDKINSVLGMNLEISDVVDVLNRLKFTVNVNGNEFNIKVPTRRQDVSIKEDIIEEVGRIYGVDNIIPTLPKSSKKGSMDIYNRELKVRLSTLGLNEVLTYSLVSEKNAKSFGNENLELIKVLEPLVSEKSNLRTSIVPSLIEVYDYNKARNITDVSIFEIGKKYYKENNEYKEEELLSILMSGELIGGINTKINVDFYYIKGVVEGVLDYLGYKNRYDFTTPVTINELHPYQSANIIVGGKCVGFIGKLHPNINKSNIYVSEINLSLLRTMKTGKIKFKEISKYPSIIKDVSFILNNNITSKEIISDIKKNSSKILSSVKVYDEYKLDIEKSLTFTLTFMDETRTLTEDEVMNEFNKIIEVITKKYNARIKNM